MPAVNSDFTQSRITKGQPEAFAVAGCEELWEVRAAWQMAPKLSLEKKKVLQSSFYSYSFLIAARGNISAKLEKIPP